MLSALLCGISSISRQQCKSASCIWCPYCCSQCCEYPCSRLETQFDQSFDDLIDIRQVQTEQQHSESVYVYCYCHCYCVLSSSIILLRQMFAWYFQRKLNKNGDKLTQLKEKKNKILEQVMDRETYKASKWRTTVHNWTNLSLTNVFLYFIGGFKSAWTLWR